MRRLTALALAALAVAADPAAAFEIHVPPGRAGEGAQLQVWVEREPGDPDHVRILKVPGTAQPGEDYEDGAIELQASDFGNVGTAVALVNTTRDGRGGEPEETFQLRTEDGSASATVTIRDWDPGLQGVHAEYGFGTPSERDGSTWVHLSTWNESDEPLVVDWRTVDLFGKANEDYVPASGRLTFPPGGRTTHEVRVELLDDRIFEGQSDFYLLLTGDRLHDVPVTMRFADDDYPTLTVDDARVREGDGPTTLRFRLRLSNPSAKEEWAVMTTGPGAGLGGASELADFVPTRTRVTFRPFALEAWFDVPVVGDALDEGDERLWAYARELAGLQPGPGSMAEGVIEDDDDAPDVSVAPPRLLGPGTVGVPVRCPAGNEACTVRLSVSFGSVARTSADARRRLRLRAGRRTVVRVRVPRAERHRLRRGEAVRVRAAAVVRGAGGDVARRTASARLRLP